MKMTLIIVLFVIGAFSVLVTSQNDLNACTIPADSMTITADTTFCPGNYTLPNGITIGADNIVLDCVGSTITGNGAEFGVDNIGFDSVTIKNCIITNFDTAIRYSSGADNGTIQNNVVDNNINSGIFLVSSSNNTIYNNTIIKVIFIILTSHKPF